MKLLFFKEFINDWRELDMKFKALTLIGIALPVLWLSMGCGSVNQEFLRQMEIQSAPLLQDLVSMKENGHSWEGIPEEDKKASIKITKEAVDKYNRTLQEAKGE